MDEKSPKRLGLAALALAALASPVVIADASAAGSSQTPSAQNDKICNPNGGACETATHNRMIGTQIKSQPSIPNGKPQNNNFVDRADKLPKNNNAIIIGKDGKPLDNNRFILGRDGKYRDSQHPNTIIIVGGAPKTP
ncbi:MAG: hypothetical protein GC166_00535 [Alphaproteobacteria bacterium]|nr:hypothetical protein [Alphaproteobacteria bacterium]